MIELNLETPEKSLTEDEKMLKESTRMPKTREQETKAMKFSPIGFGMGTTVNNPETTKDDYQSMKTTFTERFAAMVGLGQTSKIEKGKTFGTVSTIANETEKTPEQ